jgi:hypothetical protein
VTGKRVGGGRGGLCVPAVETIRWEGWYGVFGARAVASDHIGQTCSPGWPLLQRQVNSALRTLAVTLRIVRSRPIADAQPFGTSVRSVPQTGRLGQSRGRRIVAKET